MLLPQFMFKELSVGSGSIIGRENIKDFFDHISKHDDIEDKSMVDLAPNYEIAAASLVHLLEARFASLNPIKQQMFLSHTTPNRSTGFTPFFLVYGAEAVLPSDILHDSPRVAAYRDETADEARQLSVDLLEEARNLADQRSTIYQQKLHRYHSRRVKHRSFKEGDLVLRLKQEKGHKLEPPWEVPFVISKALHNGSYYLVDIHEVKDIKDNF